MLTAAVVAYPLLVGTTVAKTVLNSIVAAENAAMTALATGFIITVVVAGVLAWLTCRPASPSPSSVASPAPASELDSPSPGSRLPVS